MSVPRPQLKRPELKSDCERCAALCCIAYAAEESPGFAATKEAGQPCPKLDPNGSCTIYGKREQEGFSGCIAYDCFGAGQFVVQKHYDGRHWRGDPPLLAPMLSTFRTMRKVFELLYLVNYARGRDLTASQTELLEGLEMKLLEMTEQRETDGTSPALNRAEAKLRSLFAELGR